MKGSQRSSFPEGEGRTRLVFKRWGPLSLESEGRGQMGWMGRDVGGTGTEAKLVTPAGLQQPTLSPQRTVVAKVASSENRVQMGVQ